MSAKISIICKGIKIKLNRGENLETILSNYVKLNDEEKRIIRDYFNN